jgi:DNA modification methylase
MFEIHSGDCTEFLATQQEPHQIDLSFLDPPFNQAKDYALHDDDMPSEEYWRWMENICRSIYQRTSAGGALYFMQREKNTEQVLSCLRNSGWQLQNLIIWKKLTSAVPSSVRYGKQYQIIAYGTKGKRPRIFNRLRIDPPLPSNYKYDRKNGMFVTDIWDDIRELTSGYFAGDEALRLPNGERLHKQQSPIALLLRIILTSSTVGDTVFDPFSGTGTTLVVAHQLSRNAVGVELDPSNVEAIRRRLTPIRKADRIEHFYQDYRYTKNLQSIWGNRVPVESNGDVLDLPLFRQPNTP